MPTKTAIISGGGIAGLFAALMLVRSGGYAIHLVEQKPQTGGLFGSTVFDDGLEYDSGIHYAIETGNAEIDSILFEDMDQTNWHVFCASLPQGNVFGGRLNRESGCIDARTISADLYAQGLVALLSGGDQTGPFKTLHQELSTEYGRIYAEEIYRPVMRKLTGRELEELAPGSHRAFHISRLIVLPSLPARRLKGLAEYDRRIAYAKTADGSSSIRKYYPREGGIGRWPKLLTRRLRSQGVGIHTSETIKGIRTERGRVTQVILSDGRKLECDLLVWTAPPIMLARALGSDSTGERLNFRGVLVLHYLFERGPAVPNLHWISIYDEGAITYRVTLYDNIRAETRAAGLQLTAEVLCDKRPADVETIADRVKNELLTLGIISDGERGRLMGHEWLGNAFPIRLAGQMSSETAASANGGLRNVVVAGHQAGTAHTQTDALKSVVTGLENVGAHNRTRSSSR